MRMNKNKIKIMVVNTKQMEMWLIIIEYIKIGGKKIKKDITCKEG